jgi:glycosyltransferase involved in cell wall biosynthesis
MTTTPPNPRAFDSRLKEVLPIPPRVKVLMDLKPTLDGYAGIPQESRLLFLALRKLPGLQVEGLIQHGARILRAGISAGNRSVSLAQGINRQSRAIVSLHERPYGGFGSRFAEVVQRGMARFGLHLRVLARRSLPLGIFDATLFSDFVWRTFFSKTLGSAEKDTVTGGRFRILRIPKSLLYRTGLASLKFRKSAVFPKIDTSDYDIVVAHTPFPGRVSPHTTLVIRYHDAVPLLMPHVISDKAFHQAAHFYSLQENVRTGAWFCCISDATRQDLLSVFPEAKERCTVIHNIVSDEYFPEPSPKRLVYQIVPNRVASLKEFTTNLSQFVFDGPRLEWIDFDYLLMVSTIEPRKNHMLMLQAWERLKYSSQPSMKLIVVGNTGWDHDPVLSAFKPWAERGELLYLNNVPAAELRVLYRHAAATICPSLAEGFDYSGVEAMRCGGIVVSSDIPVHREIYEDASEYFNPYSADDAAAVIQRVVADGEEPLRQQLRDRGREISQRYTSAQLSPQWDAFIQKLTEQNVARRNES